MVKVSSLNKMTVLVLDSDETSALASLLTEHPITKQLDKLTSAMMGITETKEFYGAS